MDTKSKKWTAIVSFIAFFLGVSLLLNGLAESWSLLGSGYGRRQVWEAFSTKDYQNTTDFRRQMSSRLDEFLTMAAGGYPGYSSYGYSANTVYEGILAEDSAYFPGGIWDWPQTYAFSSQEEEEAYQKALEEALANGQDYPEPDPETAKKWADRANQYYSPDKNMLYTISYEGKVKYTNTEGTVLDGPSAALPDGYNFLLYFDGSKVTIIKDGQTIDVYGDGYYREESSDWYVPGYRNFTVDEKSAKATVCIAAAQTPVTYIKGNYSDPSNSGKQQSNELYWIYQNIQQTRTEVISVLVSLAAGVLLFLLYLIGRKQKSRADRWIAHGTGKVWFEVKLLLFLAAVIGPIIWALTTSTEFLYRLREGYIDPALLFVELGANGSSLSFILLPVFWIGYLFVNDLRYHSNACQNSLTQRVAAVFRTSDLRLPFAKRGSRMFHIFFIVQCVLLVLAVLFGIGFALGSPYSRYGAFEGMALLITAIFALIGVLSLAVQYFMAKRSRSNAVDLEKLTNQIAAVRAGELTAALELPEDADLRSAVDNLNDIQRGMHSAMDEQMKSERMKVELIANVSHDIKTPLTSIVSYVDLLKQEDSLPDHVKDYIRILDGKSQRLKTMVQDVFEVSKAASGQLPVKIERLDLGKLLRQTLADMAERIQNSPVTLKADIPEAPVMVQADGQRLYRVFQNLLQNALQYSLEGSRVHVTLTADGKTAVTSVKNTSREEIAAGVDYTERFVRGDDSRTDGGSGLGLSIASSFTEACGGRFYVENIADLFVATVCFPQIG